MHARFGEPTASSYVHELFGLSEKPFAITPDPRYLFMSERHAEALAHLLYGITEAGGFIQLTGEVGTGKTTVVRTLLERMPGHADVAVILNPQLTPLQFVLTICEELGMFVRDEDADSLKDLIDLLNKRLLEAHAKGRRVVVIVDEAQNLSPETLEQVRLLTNLETPSQKLLQIILIGQPELREVLDRVELRQLAQRITGRYHLDPLSRAESASYVNHRLRVAAANGEIFTGAALREVHRLSNGVPRIINVVCDRALLGAFTQEVHRVSPSLVRAAAGEVYGRSFSPPWMRVVAGASVAAAVTVMAFGIWRCCGRNMLNPRWQLPSKPRQFLRSRCKLHRPSWHQRHLQRKTLQTCCAITPAKPTLKARSRKSLPSGVENSIRMRDARAIRRCIRDSNACISKDRGDNCGR